MCPGTGRGGSGVGSGTACGQCTVPTWARPRPAPSAQLRLPHRAPRPAPPCKCRSRWALSAVQVSNPPVTQVAAERNLDWDRDWTEQALLQGRPPRRPEVQHRPSPGLPQGVAGRTHV